MRSVVADANVLVSFFVERNKAQQEAALALLNAAEEGEIAAVATFDRKLSNKLQTFGLDAYF